MDGDYVGTMEIKDINKLVERILRELGYPEPPLSLAHVRELLRLDLKYYTATDPSHLQEVIHRLMVGGKQVLARPSLIVDVIKKSNLSALWIPDSRRILVDNNVPKAKHRWIEGHEISHSIIPWHEGFLFGDNKTTLSPICDAIVEAEANYGAGRLLFLGDKFGKEARDVEFNFKSVKDFAKRYSNTITSTLWRMVEEREPDRAVFGMISTHPHHPDIGQSDDGDIQYFIRSACFKKQFTNITPEITYALLEKHARRNRTGPIVDAQDALVDIDGETYEFRIESFSNSYALLTYGICGIKLPRVSFV